MKIDIQELKEYPRYYRLTGAPAPSHESAEEWYESYGAHIDTAQAGSVMIQAIEYDWLDEPDDNDLLEAHRDELPDGITDDEALDLIGRARSVRDAADGVESLLLEAVEAASRGNKAVVIDALVQASSLEGEHGDDPATHHLACQLLEPTGYVVMICRDGCGREYVGTYSTEPEAEDAAEKAEGGTPEFMWATGMAAGVEVEGCDYPPPHDDEPISWHGDDAAVIREIDQ